MCVSTPAASSLETNRFHRSGVTEMAILVVKAPENFEVLTEFKAGEVKERQIVVVADVKEEVGGPSVVPVLE